jgi:hypothetical protein
VVLSDDRRIDALTEVLLRFLKSNVFATLEQTRDWSRLPLRLLKTLAAKMRDDGLIEDAIVDGLGHGYLAVEDLSQDSVDGRPPVFMLHKADPLVRAHATELKRLFGQRETLQYLLIDGELKGAVLGHWRIGPHDVDDVVLLLPPRECKDRREDVLSVISSVYKPPRSRILKYCGEKVS